MTIARTRFAYDAGDSEDIRLEKSSVFLVAGSCCLAGVVWSAMYYIVFGPGVTTLLPAAFVVVVGSALVVSHVRRDHRYAMYAQISAITVISALIQWSIGGVFDSGLVVVWAFLGPVCALMFVSVRQAVAWFVLFLVELAVTIGFDGFFAGHGQAVTGGTTLVFLSMNLGISSAVVFGFAGYYVHAAVKEQRRARALLAANLKQEVALRQSERLATLGKLSAGMAHELNNPAAAAQRGAGQLRDSIARLEEAALRLGRVALSDPQLEALASRTRMIAQRAGDPPALDALTRGDREQAVETWLDAHGAGADAWQFASTLVDMGLHGPELSALADDFSGPELPAVVAWLCHMYTARGVLADIGHGTDRIVGIVGTMKSYTYMDQAPIQSVDIRQGLDDTLAVLRSGIPEGVHIRRDYAPDLPRVEAAGSELNQVWTNLIDNAICALNGTGDIVLKTYRQDSWVIVEVRDTGPGIPPDIQERIFDPFFTTRAPGEGTGLGLSMCHTTIVQKHKGRITVTSRPGDTCFQVRLPLTSGGPHDG